MQQSIVCSQFNETVNRNGHPLLVLEEKQNSSVNVHCTAAKLIKCLAFVTFLSRQEQYPQLFGLNINKTLIA